MNGIPFTCRSIGFELHTEQSVSLPSTLGSTDAKKSVRVAGDPMIYAPPIGQFSQEMLALDVPLIVPLDRGIVSSASSINWGATTRHLLIIKATVGNSAAAEITFAQSFAIPIKTYDTLPLYRQYNEPIKDIQLSDDKQVQVEINLPNSAVGPQDKIAVNLRFVANALHRNISKSLLLKLVTVQLKEVLECFDGGLPARKENKLHSSTKEYGIPLTTEAVPFNFQLPFPYHNDLLDLYTSEDENVHNTDFGRGMGGPLAGQVNLAIVSFTKSSNFPEIEEGIPLTHVRGFTLIGKLYALRYELVLKIKIGHGKDFEYTLPITVSPFDRSSSAYLIDWIKGECQKARDRFGRELVKKFVNSHSWDSTYWDLKRYIPPPSVYYNTREDWVNLGYNPEAYGRPHIEKTLSDYID